VDAGNKDRARRAVLCVESTVSRRRSTVMHGDRSTVHGERGTIHGDRAANGEGTLYRGHHRGTGSGTP
jgi:hypothetical protein